MVVSIKSFCRTLRGVVSIRGSCSLAAADVLFSKASVAASDEAARSLIKSCKIDKRG